MAAWRFMHSGSACMMIEFRSDHACIMHNSETDWMHARGQPASARAWPAASGQLAGWRIWRQRLSVERMCDETMQAVSHRMICRLSARVDCTPASAHSRWTTSQIWGEALCDTQATRLLRPCDT